MERIVIYKITSPTNKIYIGQSWDFVKRKSVYKRLACKNQKFIYNSLLKHGYINHTIEIIEEFTSEVSQEMLNNREIYWWKYYKELGFMMMNIKEPGSNGKMSKESVAKNKATRLENVKKNGYWFSPEILKKRKYGKKVIDTITGEMYDMIQIAAPFYNTTPAYLRSMLNGQKKNKTPLIYYKDGNCL